MNLRRFWRNDFIVFGILVIGWMIFSRLPAATLGLEETQKITAVGFLDLMSKLSGLYVTIKELVGVTPQAISSPVEEPLFKTISLDDLQKGLEQIAWVDRGATSINHLRRYGWILITGKQGLGKSREAVELVKAAVNEELVSADHVYTIEGKLWRSPRDKAARNLSIPIDTESSALILVDGLPVINTTGALKDLARAFASLKPFSNIYIIVTATPEESQTYKAWFDEQGFREIQLPELNARQTGQLISNAAKAFKLTLEQSGRDALLKMRDGTPASTLLILRHLQRSGKKRITARLAQQSARSTLAGEQPAARRMLLNRIPSMDYFLLALDSFHAARIKPDTAQVLEYAEHLWREKAGWRRFTQGAPAFRQELQKLSSFDIREEDGVIIHPAGLIESPPDPEQARRELVEFLESRKRPSLQEMAARFARLYIWVFRLILMLVTALILSVMEVFSVVGGLAVFREQITFQTLVLSFWIIVVLYALIGAFQGWVKGLLVSFSVMAALSVVSLNGNIQSPSEFLPGLSPTENFIVIGSIIAMGAFAIYGIFLFFPHRDSRASRERLQDSQLGMVLGALNGYLIGGSLLYYLYYLLTRESQIAGLTFPALDLAADPLNRLAAYLPPELLGTPGIYVALVVLIIFLLIVLI